MTDRTALDGCLARADQVLAQVTHPAAVANPNCWATAYPDDGKSEYGGGCLRPGTHGSGLCARHAADLIPRDDTTPVATPTA